MWLKNILNRIQMQINNYLSSEDSLSWNVRLANYLSVTVIQIIVIPFLAWKWLCLYNLNGLCRSLISEMLPCVLVFAFNLLSFRVYQVNWFHISWKHHFHLAITNVCYIIHIYAWTYALLNEHYKSLSKTINAKCH